MELLQIGVVTSFYVVLVFLFWFFVVTMFLVLSDFLSRPRKSIATDFCSHLT